MSQGKRIVLAARPVGEPKPSDFRLEEFAVPTPGPGEVLLRTIWLSLDPYMRGRMSEGPSYAAPVPIGGVMEGEAVSEVAASNNADFAVGDIVRIRSGWQTHAISSGKGLIKVDPKLGPISTSIGVLGMPGMTAYTGLIAHYNDTEAKPPKWAASMMRATLTKRLTFRGFIVSDFASRHGDFLRDMSAWVREGKVKYKEFVTEGLESAPGAFMGLLKGANFGKQLVRVGPDKA
ncbi:N-terminal domain of oxidoreductase [Bradyrhizobium sp. Rc2d]|uniref:MDR family NADP-dependent oxidoreductase n=1 Tax=Bradyrhizobium sp. Rc2d TaxID=1855321 RepID=UPI000882B0DA|nr:NADP-dependent oxidoreductase [Bradyrhizobium sp. Rc2d]SDJ39195.1 N-terminal domain of oxidoreductase [Bradyrhizobium sp. Rc2d]